MQQQAQQQQVAQLVQQAQQQGMDPVQAAMFAVQQMQGQQQPMAQDSQMIDDMLLDTSSAPPMMMGEGDIEMDAPSMDMSDAQLGPEDDVLKTLFAADQDDQGQQQQAQQQKQAHAVRTASTRTVGTRPTGGVSAIGGNPGTSSNEVGKLASLWGSSPDVREVFGMNKS